ncbi:MAG: spermine/spermidine synthase [Candidatus Latescibacteria bacterium]|nr:spermine/spermidine synthase [Candidatus Latescibacterota bacterium]
MVERTFQGLAMDRRVVQRSSTRTGELQLASVQAGTVTHFELIVNGVFLMATYNALSNRALIDTVMETSKSGRHINLLIGGLGMGISLRQALAYSNVRSVCVVEFESRIINWNREYLDNADVLDDVRTEVVVGDFYEYVQGNPRSYHGIVLDIDNGPDRVVRPENRRAYSVSALQTLRTRLRPDGTLAIWSHAVNRSYERALDRVFGGVTRQQTCDHSLTGKPLEGVIYAVRA